MMRAAARKTEDLLVVGGKQYLPLVPAPVEIRRIHGDAFAQRFAVVVAEFGWNVAAIDAEKMPI